MNIAEIEAPDFDLKIENPTYSIISYPSALLPDQYTALIYSKWLRSLRFGNPIFKNMPSNIYYKEYHTFIENLLKKPDSIIRLAVLTDDHDVVLGFSVIREDVLDYVHVHKDQRKQGIAKALVPPGITTMSHITTVAMEIWQPKQDKKYSHLSFNPYA